MNIQALPTFPKQIACYQCMNRLKECMSSPVANRFSPEIDVGTFDTVKQAVPSIERCSSKVWTRRLSVLPKGAFSCNLVLSETTDRSCYTTLSFGPMISAHPAGYPNLWISDQNLIGRLMVTRTLTNIPRSAFRVSSCRKLIKPLNLHLPRRSDSEHS